MLKVHYVKTETYITVLRKNPPMSGNCDLSSDASLTENLLLTKSVLRKQTDLAHTDVVLNVLITDTMLEITDTLLNTRETFSFIQNTICNENSY